MEETNAWQAVRNNAYGTCVLARAAVAAKVEKFVLVSTDKAVNPTNVMGATKRLAEMVCQSLQGARHAVRAGALRQRVRQRGQRDPALPASRSRAAARSPSRIRRSRATSCRSRKRRSSCCRRGCRARGGEILVLDMGEPVRIVDLARDLIRLSGADPDEIADRVHGPASRREALRGAARRRGGDASRRRIRSCASRRRARPTATPSARWSRGASATAPPTTPKCARG